MKDRGRRVSGRHVRVAALAATAIALTGGDAAAPTISPAATAALRAADLRVASIGHRLAVRNAALCVDRQSQTGLVLHSLRQYLPKQRAGVRAAFGFTRDVAVEAVVPDSPAARAGVVADDQIVAVAGTEVPGALPTDSAPGSTEARDAVYARIATSAPTAPLPLTIERAGQRRTLALPPEPGCRVRFEITGDDESGADSSLVQIGAPFLDRFDDAGLAVVIAHELAHVVLRTEARLTDARASFGAFAELGRSGRLHRQAEVEADRLSVYILYNAGVDPLVAGQFWRGPGRKLDAGLFRSRIYPDWRARAAALDAEAAKIPAGAPRPVVPAMLAARDTPLR